MADPLTALGAAAAASQFVSQGLSISIYFYQAFSNIREAPEHVRKALAEIDQIRSVSNLILNTPSLQIDSIASILHACVEDITILHGVLRQLSPKDEAGGLEKLRKAFMAVLKERNIMTLVARLDREKMNLLLCMHQIDSTLLHTIGIALQGVQTNVGDLHLLVRDTAQNVQTVVDVLPGVASQVTTIYDNIPEISHNLTTMSDEMLPAIFDLIKSNHEKTMAAILGCSSKAEGYFNAPNRSSRNLIKRQDVLTKLGEFQSRADQTSTVMVVQGLGGQGKSQVALQYCQDTRDSPFKTTFWIDATSEASLRRAFEVFYSRFRPHSENRLESIEAIITFVRDVFERMSSPWLIVFDNFDNPDAIPDIRDYIPSTKAGTILFTTRHTGAKVLATPGCAISLESLRPEDAAKLLLACAGITTTGESLDDATTITTRLSNHALAIVQAGAYISRRRLSLGEFLDHYNRNLQVVLSENHLLLSEYRRNLGNDEQATSLSVFTTWELSFQQLKQEAEGPKRYKADLLTLLGFLYGQQISEDLLKTFCLNVQAWDSVDAMRNAPGAFISEQLGHWSSDVFSEFLSEFHALSLIESLDRAEDGSYITSLHSLVKDWITLRTKPEASWEYKILATEILVETLNPSKTLQPRSVFALEDKDILHDQYTEERNDQETVILGIDAHNGIALRHLEIQGQLASLMSDHGHYKSSIKLARRLVVLNEALYKEGTLEIIKAKLLLAKALRLDGNFTEAESINKKIYAQATILQGFEGVTCREIASEIALLLARTGYYSEALALLDRLLNYQIQHGGLENLTGAGICGQIANIHTKQGKLAEARDMFTNILKSCFHGQDECNKMRLTLINSLGRVYTFMGDHMLAAENFEYVWKARVEDLGPRHPDTLSSRTSIVAILMKLEKFDEALRIQKEVTDDMVNVLGPDHPETLANLNNLGWILAVAQNLDEAEVAFRTVLDNHLVSVKTKGLTSFNPMSSMRGLIHILRDMGDLEAANNAMEHYFSQVNQISGEDVTWNPKAKQELLSLIREVSTERRDWYTNVKISPG